MRDPDVIERSRALRDLGFRAVKLHGALIHPECRTSTETLFTSAFIKDPHPLATCARCGNDLMTVPGEPELPLQPVHVIKLAAAMFFNTAPPAWDRLLADYRLMDRMRIVREAMRMGSRLANQRTGGRLAVAVGIPVFAYPMSQN